MSEPAWVPLASAGAVGVPSGVVAPFGGGTIPAGWLACDGAAVSRTTYAALYAVVGTSYGVGDGSTTFNLPDLRGRVAVGKGTNASVLTLGLNDGVAVANRRPHHRHTTHRHQVGTIGGLGGGANNAPYSSAVDWQTSFSDGGSGNVNDSLDAPAFLVVNYMVKV